MIHFCRVTSFINFASFCCSFPKLPRIFKISTWQFKIRQRISDLLSAHAPPLQLTPRRHDNNSAASRTLCVATANQLPGIASPDATLPSILDVWRNRDVQSAILTVVILLRPQVAVEFQQPCQLSVPVERVTEQYKEASSWQVHSKRTESGSYRSSFRRNYSCSVHLHLSLRVDIGWVVQAVSSDVFHGTYTAIASLGVPTAPLCSVVDVLDRGTGHGRMLCREGSAFTDGQQGLGFIIHQTMMLNSAFIEDLRLLCYRKLTYAATWLALPRLEELALEKTSCVFSKLRQTGGENILCFVLNCWL